VFLYILEEAMNYAVIGHWENYPSAGDEILA
jgi:hypothetical protein